MALFSIIIAEFTSSRMGKLVFWPLVVLGVFPSFIGISLKAMVQVI